MLYRIAGGVGLVLLGVSTAGFVAISAMLIGILLIIGGIGLVAGI